VKMRIVAGRTIGGKFELNRKKINERQKKMKQKMTSKI
jgi:hypothetical protein